MDRPPWGSRLFKWQRDKLKQGNADRSQLIDEFYDSSAKQKDPVDCAPRLPPKNSVGQQYKIPKRTVMINDYPPAPGTGQIVAPASGEYNRYGSNYVEKPLYEPPMDNPVSAHRLARLETELNNSKAALQKMRSELVHTVLPAFGTFRCDKSHLENVVKNGQWDELKELVTQKRVEYQLMALEADEWKKKFQQQQQNVTDIKQRVDMVFASYMIPAPEGKPKNFDGENISAPPPSMPKAQLSQPIGSRKPILSNFDTGKDESFQNRRDQPQRRPYGAEQGEPKRYRMDYTDLDSQGSEEYGYE